MELYTAVHTVPCIPPCPAVRPSQITTGYNPHPPWLGSDEANDVTDTNCVPEYVVDGTAIPDVDFDVGESYAGLMPLENSTKDEFYFWFFPSTNAAADGEILIWLNGGLTLTSKPGCSSLEGLLQENGPFLWQYGTYKPVQNPYSWTRLTNVVYIEQPIGTGFSQGTPTAKDEEDVADQFMRFWKNFVDTFGMTGYKVYITGESYAGMFVPYIASGMLDAKDTTYFNVSGIMVYDPSIAYDFLQGSVTAVPFIDSNAAVFPLNTDTLATYHALDTECGYADFREKYLSFPPPGALPGPDDLPGRGNVTCTTLYDKIYDAINEKNPCFDIYQVATTCPVLWDVLGFPGSFEYVPEGATIYFNRSDVQAAINAPSVEWSSCTDVNVFPDGDSSAPSATTVLGSVVDRTQNVIVGHGSLDMVLIANGTLLAIQNMTWGGLQGFQEAPSANFYVPHHKDYSDSTLAAEGVMGITHSERGLTWVTIDLSGHMVPQYQPSASFRHIEVLLGRVSSLTSVEPFTVNVATV
ncbi:Serine-type carboxypeptidase F [Cytospora mali]|uniref:Carboxypeptidase n=1 Tax=Cytospora mali TaxID=578113 RepID=A0A194VMM7_CYTMA|nr:Serine-type carboxypeptidase F [Valsa mali]